MISDKESYLAKLLEIQNSNIDDTYIFSQTPIEDRFAINGNTRVINIPTQFKNIGVINDHNAETVFFEIDRYFDNEDLSTHTCIVQYINANGEDDIYLVTKKDLSEDGKYVFGWTISNHVTKYAGSVKFAVRFFTIGGQEILYYKYNWNTIVGQFNVEDGLNVTNSTTIQTDFLGQWMTMMQDATDDCINATNESKSATLLSNIATQAANTATTKANTATTNANDKATLAKDAADRVNAVIDLYGDKGENIELAYTPRLYDVEQRVGNIEGYIGYTDADIYGVEWDVPNRTVTRLAGSKNLTAGANFDNLMPWKRRRCILNDAGAVLAYYGEAAYTETGKLTQAVTIGETTYPIGTTCQVMVEQPLFYYKAVPIDFRKIDGQRGLSVKKIRYYVSGFPHTGFKPHPQFVRAGKIISKIYKAAFEACAYDVSASSYLLTDEQIADFTATTGDKLSSIAGAKPYSGRTQDATRAKTRILAKNRGEGWGQADFISNSGTQLLFLIEYASFDSQSVIGQGVVNVVEDSNDANSSINTGSTSFLGNASGMAPGTNGLVSISYRGEENFWGNIWGWEDAINVRNISITDFGYAYFNQPDYRTVNPADSTDTNYKEVGFQIAPTTGYASAIGWSEDCDFAFLATETAGSSSIPLNDYFYQNKDYIGWLVSRWGGSWNYGLNAGAFCRIVGTAPSARYIGGRVLFVPAA
ncbi:hypothetical protein [Lacrimispora indolis]|uniref:hypothetical protein n=1 Tax=Lacrimispora indolis TaxID=69825 RepID=UPI0003F5EEDD|nr:hypothetical protein [[Clostridium] methoxybenzovorans]